MSQNPPDFPRDSPLDPVTVRRRQLEARLTDLSKHLASLDRDSRRVRWLALLGLSTVPAGYWWGARGVMLALAATIFLVGSAVYLIWGHRGEYLQKIAETRQQLRRLDA